MRLAVVGRKGAGKTLLVEQAFGVQIRGEVNGSTQTPQLYGVDSNLIVADLPGLHSASVLQATSLAHMLDARVDAFIFLIDGSTSTGDSIDVEFLLSYPLRLQAPCLVLLSHMDASRAEPMARLRESPEHHRQDILSKIVGNRIDNASQILSFRDIPEKGKPEPVNYAWLYCCNGGRQQQDVTELVQRRRIATPALVREWADSVAQYVAAQDQKWKLND